MHESKEKTEYVHEWFDCGMHLTLICIDGLMVVERSDIIIMILDLGYFR